ncbi:MAG: hypothetical protein IPF99_15315 [Deltaproteobacteria bacterium]|jgi:hypothetical protein|nr:hypothetical protein [Deltaproteobacteria bacterium]MBK7065978.1 hypothetical protein [Deltaproteobacteria bacterium]
MTAQLLSVKVPFSTTELQMGSSVGGPGVSLCTESDVLLDSVGVMDIQSKGTFMAQTNATMAMLSASVQKIHSQGKVEIWAGGGKAPASCGLSAPAAPTDAGPPGATVEKTTGLACSALSLTSANFGLSDTFSGSIPAYAVSVGVYGVAAHGALTSIAAATGMDIGGGAPDIEERASANIKMVAGKKISGLAPQIISSKTLGKYEVKALLVTDFTTLLFTNFALAKFEVKALDAFKTTSRSFEVDGSATIDIETKDFKGKSKTIVMNGITKVTKVMGVDGKTELADDMLVDRNALMTGALFVIGNTEVKGTLTVSKNTTVKSTQTVDGKVKTDTLEFKSRVTFGL